MITFLFEDVLFNCFDVDFTKTFLLYIFFLLLLYLHVLHQFSLRDSLLPQFSRSTSTKVLRLNLLLYYVFEVSLLLCERQGSDTLEAASLSDWTGTAMISNKIYLKK